MSALKGVHLGVREYVGMVIVRRMAGHGSFNVVRHIIRAVQTEITKG